MSKDIYNKLIKIISIMVIIISFLGVSLDFIFLLYLFFIILIIYILLILFNKYIVKDIYNDVSNSPTFIKDYGYSKKSFMTHSEYIFYTKIKDLENDYKIVPQVNLASIINKNSDGYNNELFKNIDFAIFSKDYSTLLLLIELNDSSHNEYNRIKRDVKVRNICDKAGIKLITFYTKYSNDKNYLLSRILKEINNIKNN